MSSLMQWDEMGFLRPMVKEGIKPANPGGQCPDTRIRVLAGSGITDGKGEWNLDLTGVECGEKLGQVRAVSFVATTTYNPIIDPESTGSTNRPTKPSYITTASTATGGAVTLYSRTWNCHCQPKPHTPFDYHVAIAYDRIG